MFSATILRFRTNPQCKSRFNLPSELVSSQANIGYSCLHVFRIYFGAILGTYGVTGLIYSIRPRSRAMILRPSPNFICSTHEQWGQ